jgi:hypothetical protein
VVDGTSIGGILGLLRDLRMLHAANLELERENQQQRYRSHIRGTSRLYG